ncbi:Tripartite DNA replication factor [Ascosphaera atra]|nr:Tripartite DNA replication factor [Ascosphaera atra]
MDKNRFQSKRLRELIIDNLPPNFKAVPSSAIAAVSLSQTNLNVDQKNAIEKVLSADDYALVLGMPGTGKTTTIAHIIRALVSKGKSVLLASYTHTAVDNILLKVRNDNFKILRLGAAAKVHSEVQSFAQLASVPKKTIEELRDCYENSQIVATTCLGVNHSIFNNRVFDYCIVDEASQITLPVCLGPIRMAQTFILVGDHYQLPPLVQNKEAQEGGLDISLFKLLCDQQPKSVVYLEHQYRMCKEIMLLSNQLIYSNHLKCGTPGVAAKTLEIPKMQALKLHHAPSSSIPTTSSARAEMCVGLRCWLRDLVHPAAKARLVNTDLLKPEATEDAKGSRIINEAEATICAQLAESLITVGVPASEIGIVTLYRSQLALLKSRLRHQPDLEMHTADRFQGRDKEVIIMSCVRSNQEHNVGDLLRDWRRVNVAFTRARSKLLVVGSKSTLHGGNALLAKFVRLMDGKGWTYDLPPSAAEGHVFEQLTLNGVGFTQQQQEKTPDKKETPAMKPWAVHSRSPLKATVGTGNMKQTTSSVSSSSKKVRFSQSAKGLNGKGSSLNDRCIDTSNVQKPGSGGIRQPQKVGPRPRDASNLVSKRPLLRDIYNDRAG